MIAEEEVGCLGEFKLSSRTEQCKHLYKVERERMYLTNEFKIFHSSILGSRT